MVAEIHKEQSDVSVDLQLEYESKDQLIARNAGIANRIQDWLELRKRRNDITLRMSGYYQATFNIDEYTFFLDTGVYDESFQKSQLEGFNLLVSKKDIGWVAMLEFCNFRPEFQEQFLTEILPKFYGKQHYKPQHVPNMIRNGFAWGAPLGIS